jgi:hypothetical protein
MPKTALTSALLLIALSAAIAAADRVSPLPQAHAHNDYLHERPLLDALDHGFCSVEADVFLVEGELLVAHTRAECDAGRTLRRLYLDPLQQRVRENGGRVYPDGPEFTLLIDIKADGEATWRVLNEQLSQYADVFSSVEDGTVTPRAVTAIISGERPQPLIAATSPRFAGIDGRLSDLDSDHPAHLMPLISDNWRTHFRWRGEGPLPENEQARLNHIVATAHARQRKLRLWATPDTPAAWQALHEAGVDLINTDDLNGLRQFLLQHEAAGG